MASWQLQEAKARLSELVKELEAEGPQVITVRGQPVAVVLSRTDYDKLCGRNEPQGLADFLLKSPLAGLDLDLERDQTCEK